MSVNKYDKHIAESAYKNVVKNKSNTDVNLAWYEEPETVAPKVDAKSVWLDSEFIPESPENLRWRGNLHYIAVNGTSVAIIERFRKEELLKVNDRAVFYSAKLVDALQDENYHIRIEDAEGNVLPFGLKKWTIDGGVGYLSFVEGMPTEYKQPFYVTGFRYCGRKLPEHMITTDGRQTLLEGYYPEKDQSVATKLYVDDEIAKLNKDVERMLPPKPETFEGKDLKFICDKRFSATDITNLVEYENVVMSDWEWTIDIPEFYNPGHGRISLMVSINSIWQEFAWIELSNVPGKSAATAMEIDYDGDAYSNSLASRGFYNSIKCHYTGSFDSLSGLFKSHVAPTKFVVRYLYNNETFMSNELVVCEEHSQETEALNGTSIVLNSTNMKYKFVSGILTPDVGSAIDLSGVKHTTLKRFTQGFPYEDVTMFDETVSHIPEIPYEKYVPALETTQTFEIKKDYYSETMKVEVNTYNVFGERNGSISKSYNFRIDTVSDESDRVTSGVVENDRISGACSEWNSAMDLRNTNELQLLGGIYQWPEKDFSVNGTGSIIDGTWSDVSWIRTSLDYSVCSKFGERFVTFKREIPLSNGIFISFVDGNNIKQDKETMSFLLSSLLIKIDGETDWLDAQEPYDGIGTNTKWMQGCLAVQNCEKEKIYCTFGPKPIEGILYVRIGIEYDSKITFKNITVEPNI